MWLDYDCYLHITTEWLSTFRCFLAQQYKSDPHIVPMWYDNSSLSKPTVDGLVPKILPCKVSQYTSANPDSDLLMGSYPTTKRKKLVIQNLEVIYIIWAKANWLGFYWPDFERRTHTNTSYESSETIFHVSTEVVYF